MVEREETKIRFTSNTFYSLLLLLKRKRKNKIKCLLEKHQVKSTNLYTKETLQHFGAL